MRQFFLAIAAVTMATGPAQGTSADAATDYAVMAGLAQMSAAQREAIFDDTLAGGETCAPQLYLDRMDAGTLEVSVLAPCHGGAAITLLHHGKATAARLSELGAHIVRLDSAGDAERVTVAFDDGTLVARDSAPAELDRTGLR